MTRHVYPVIDANTRDAMIFGFAATERGAVQVAKRGLKGTGYTNIITGVEKQHSVAIRFDPHIHTAAEVRRANRIGSAWVLVEAPE